MAKTDLSQIESKLLIERSITRRHAHWHTGQMKDIVQSLYNLIAQTYDHAGAATISAMEREMCDRSISSFSQ